MKRNDLAQYEYESRGGNLTHSIEGPQWSRRRFVSGVGATCSGGLLSELSDTATVNRDRLSTSQASQLSQLWSTELTDTVQDYLIEDGLLYVGTADGIVRTLDVETGREVNRIEFEGAIPPYGLAKDGDSLAIALKNSRLKIVDIKSYSVQMTLPFGGKFMGITAKNSSAYIATQSTVESIGLSDGESHWSFDSKAMSPIWSTTEGVAVLLHQEFFLLNEDNGEKVWKQQVRDLVMPSTKTGNWLEADHYWGLTELDSYLVLADVDSLSGGDYTAIDKFTGESLWYETSDRVNPAIATSSQVYYQQDSSVVSRNLDSGEQLWKTDVVTPHAKSMALYDDSLIVFGTRKSDEANVMMALNPSSRALQWERKVDGLIGLVETSGSRLFGVDLETDEISAYVPEGSKTDNAGGATSTQDSGSQSVRTDRDPTTTEMATDSASSTNNEVAPSAPDSNTTPAPGLLPRIPEPFTDLSNIANTIIALMIAFFSWRGLKYSKETESE